jgi:hypothetical protein
VPDKIVVQIFRKCYNISMLSIKAEQKNRHTDYTAHGDYTLDKRRRVKPLKPALPKISTETPNTTRPSLSRGGFTLTGCGFKFTGGGFNVNQSPIARHE